MRTTILIAALGLVLGNLPSVAGELEPPGAPAPTMKTLDQIYNVAGSAAGNGFQFVGTTTPASPDLGVLGMARRCQTEFGAGTRMCTSVEVLNTYTLPSKSVWNSTKGWVRPVIQGVVGFDNIHVAEPSGLLFENIDRLPSCHGWSHASGSTAIAILAPDAEKEGQFEALACSSSDVGVACCGMVSP